MLLPWSRTFLFIVSYFLGGWLGFALTLNTSYAAETTQVNPKLSVEEKIAPLSDKEVRSLLIEKMTADAESRKRQYMFNTFRDHEGLFKQRFQAIKEDLSQWPEISSQLYQNILGGNDGDFVQFLLFSVGMLVFGILVEKVLSIKLSQFNQRILTQESHEWTTVLGYFLLRVCFNLISVGFFAAGCALFIFWIELFDGTENAMLSVLYAVINIRVVYVLSRAVFAPHSKGIRPLPLQCMDAARFHHWVILFSVIYFFMGEIFSLALANGWPQVLNDFAVPTLVGLPLVALVIIFTWRERKLIAELFKEKLAQPEKKEQKDCSNAVQIVAQAWPFLFTFWIITLWAVWAMNLIAGNYELANKVSIAWWITLFFPLIDRIFYRLLLKVITINWLQSRTFPERSYRFVHVLQLGFRILLIGSAIIALAESWGYGALAMLNTAVGQRMIYAAVDIMITLLMAYIAWEVIHSLIERKLPEPPSEDEAGNLEGEGGGAGASRVETFLPLLRTFLLAVIVVTVIITILQSLGVQIGPLIAGAGVVGIAIGFGAQKLVQDIISGVFFLWDDAFRRGEYIEAAGLRGTVERISIRSMCLRHHLGAVQTLPYSEIATVVNLSRDWVTMKLELRLPYDTDLEKVRKIIKKVGQQMADDPEYGQHFLLPLKSQGVTRVEESALIVRMKFTCKPGEQWVIRREAYRRVKEALEENGIKFAHREVRVRLPDEGEDGSEATGNIPLPSHIAKSAAAIAAVLAADEIKKQNRIDDNKADSFDQDEGDI
ncbi:mechanosensitive ion channel family protein [Zooshikella sp. RANM57]|uniref:mechanosensitive ion channel family protein n=1 Tax=Zooshikella sp. RANM57 TaxID=3425863 RepID=UPI003D6EEFC0